MKKEAGQVVPPPLFSPLGEPATLTEGEWPVVCWPVYIIPESRKKVPEEPRKMTKITVGK